MMLVRFCKALLDGQKMIFETRLCMLLLPQPVPKYHQQSFNWPSCILHFVIFQFFHL